MPKQFSELKDQMFGSSQGPGGEMFKINPSAAGCRRYLYIGLGVAFLLVLFTAFKIVPAGSRAVIFNNISGGLSARGEGTTLLVPFLQSATVYDVKTRTYTMSKTHEEGEVKGDDSIRALTSDGQPGGRGYLRAISS
ncbi:MAG TPA: SPFH domain-containing protein [Blastocatellia bacterium]|nr:SPFH domain-containing protein [Blastocatellia bacterium]